MTGFHAAVNRTDVLLRRRDRLCQARCFQLLPDLAVHQQVAIQVIERSQFQLLRVGATFVFFRRNLPQIIVCQGRTSTFFQRANN
ncbi:hypothetical protein D3C81_1028190 [compost metagenome]